MKLQIKIKEYQAGQIMFSLLQKYAGFFILVIGEEEIQENENADTVHLKVQIVSNKSRAYLQSRQLRTEALWNRNYLKVRVLLSMLIAPIRAVIQLCFTLLLAQCIHRIVKIPQNIRKRILIICFINFQKNRMRYWLSGAIINAAGFSPPPLPNPELIYSLSTSLLPVGGKKCFGESGRAVYLFRQLLENSKWIVQYLSLITHLIWTNFIWMSEHLLKEMCKAAFESPRKNTGWFGGFSMLLKDSFQLAVCPRMSTCW